MKKTLSFLLALCTIFSMSLPIFAKENSTITVKNASPIITEEQFRELDSQLETETLTIEGRGWSYDVRIKEQSTVNMKHYRRSISEIVQRFPEQEFLFLSFPAGPVFDFTGTLSIDVSDLLEEHDTLYAYSYYQGKLSRIWATVDEYEGTLSFPTKYFGHFVITDKEIPHGTVVSATADKVNPHTGA